MLILGAWLPLPGAARRGGPVVDIQTEHRNEGGWDVLDVAGEVDLSTAPALRSHLEGLVVGGSRRVIVDLEHVTFMDSSGLSVLVSAFKGMREAGGRMAVVCPNDTIAKIFTITGLDKVFEVRATVAEAVTA